MGLALGTAQFGLDYGITNSTGKVSIDEAKSIVQFAYDSGLRVIDTAVSYGDSEQVLGEICESFNDLRFITKLPASKNEIINIEDKVSESLANLRTKRIHGVLFHDEKDAISSQSYNYFKVLNGLKRNDKIQKIGVSLYSTKALAAVLAMHDIDIIQIPANWLDQRFMLSGLIEKAKMLGVEVHVRSLFLQGLLLNEATELPVKLKPYFSEIQEYYQMANSLSLTPLEMALSYLSGNDSIDYGVFGCLNVAQYKQVLAAYNKVKKLDQKLDLPSLASSSLLINPSLWFT